MKKIFLSLSFIFGTLIILSFCINKTKDKVKVKLTNVPKVWYSEELIPLNKLSESDQASAIEKAIVLLKNKDLCLPIGKLNRQLSAISFGGPAKNFHETIGLFADATISEYHTLSECSDTSLNRIKASEICIISLHADGTKGTENEIDSKNLAILDKLPASQLKILILFGNDQLLKQLNPGSVDVIIWAKENHYLAQNRVAQLLFGASAAQGKLTKDIGDFKVGDGISTKTNGRLKFGQAEDLGINPLKLNQIDEIALKGIEDGAYPGCQIVVAVKGTIIYRKSFGKQTKNGENVSNTDVYDIASITKIAASTLLTMHLIDEGLLDIDKKLGDYIPEITGKGPYSQIIIREMMAHQAGLTPWIAFFKKTMNNGILSSSIYASEKRDGYQLQVAEGIFMKNDYVDSMYKQIVTTPLGSKKYEYSDLCYYFTQKIIEKIIQKKQNDYLLSKIYLPMGLRYTRYLPLNFFSRSQIIPTENDKTFRKQLIHGFVHDPGAAMLGGVAGHAGVFSNATDLASIMQLFLNNGEYAGMKFFTEKITNDFTRAQYPGNRRGVGFDRPNASGGGTCDELASSESFGHSGFTGTLAWADPKNDVVFIFLSNRVNPDQNNWKLRDMGIRTKIQHVVYEAVNSRKK
jgi:CubicO group peptidase (beta-lactamase class C family)